jgi:hypothetical protein
MCLAMVHGTAAMMVSRDTKCLHGGDFPRISAASAHAVGRAAAPTPPAKLGQKCASMVQEACGGGGAGIEMYLTAGGSPNWMRISECRHTSA